MRNARRRADHLVLLLGGCLGLCSACRAVLPAARPPEHAVPTTGEADAETTPHDSSGGEAPALAEAHDEPAHPDDPPAGETLDDSGENDDPSAPEATSVRPHPLDGWSDAQVAQAVRQDLTSLGSMSVGSPNAGALLNGVQAGETPLYKPVSPSGAWSTQETLDFLAAALRRVHDQFPGTEPLELGDISNKRGGHSPPHVSHQAGRDVDIAYFYSDGSRWYARGTARNLDLPRNWAFVRALITETDVDLILIDHSIQTLLEEYAKAQGEDPDWLNSVFRGVPGKQRALIRHAPGHATHIHIRFFNPIAQETARRCHAALLEAKLVPTPQSFITHKVKKNETLGMIARKYGVPVPRLRAANGLKSSLIREKSLLRVPIARRGPGPAAPRLRLPVRRLPPAVAPAQPPPTK